MYDKKIKITQLYNFMVQLRTRGSIQLLTGTTPALTAVTYYNYWERRHYSSECKSTQRDKPGETMCMHVSYGEDQYDEEEVCINNITKSKT